MDVPLNGRPLGDQVAIPFQVLMYELGMYKCGSWRHRCFTRARASPRTSAAIPTTFGDLRRNLSDCWTPFSCMATHSFILSSNMLSLILLHLPVLCYASQNPYRDCRSWYRAKGSEDRVLHRVVATGRASTVAGRATLGVEERTGSRAGSTHLLCLRHQ